MIKKKKLPVFLDDIYIQALMVVLFPSLHMDVQDYPTVEIDFF